jgi:hypothetical protein
MRPLYNLNLNRDLARNRFILDHDQEHDLEQDQDCEY